jgi:gluconolactonase
VDHAAGNFLSEGAASAAYEGGKIQRADITTGAVETLYTVCEGRALSAPNDIVFDEDGGFWFTDRGRNTATAHDHGGLFYARADGSLIVRAVDRISCNGVGLSPDGKTLYTALTEERHLLAFDIVDRGKVAPVGNYVQGRVAASFPSRQFLDSLAVMADGRVAQAIIWERSGIAIVDPATGSTEHLDFHDHFTTNICFGGPDMCDAWVTLSETGRLAKVRWNSPGLRLNY